ncbi:hypothetical protein K3152_00175 [Qipengyuania sp. 1NDH17]|uniref:Helix-turn-helix domain-containing protein n=1 Tax=Qipengyuania polymorpha TaxID=2867234 RepID=A0ABS7ITJ7_9SPHN|nr:hypothetical protein [Qipengyuania polymorpha]MBX7456652.1 hypothetical protein [Qipengyuania polymorpha]
MAKKRNKKRKVDATGRNTHEKFVMMEHWLLSSPAYRLLSPPARALLVEFRYRFNGVNNGQIFMSQRDAAKVLGIATHATAGKYIKELVARGFLQVVVPGSFDNKQPLASVYRLTMVTNADEKGPPTKEFMSLSLTDAEKSRIEKMKPSWAKRRPVGLKSLPDGMVHEFENQPRDAQIRGHNGANDCSTYNIPGGQSESTQQCTSRRAA